MTPCILALVGPDSCVTVIYMFGYRGGKMSRVFPPKGTKLERKLSLSLDEPHSQFIGNS